MKKLIIIFLIFGVFVPSNAVMLTGGIKYTQEDARIELQNNKPSASFILNADIIDPNYNQNYNYILKGLTKLSDRTLAKFSDGSYGVNYKKDILHVYYYDKDGTLISAEIKTSVEFPYRTYKYNPDGELVTMTMRVSENETFIFNPHGKLLGHWIGKNCYDENGKILMTRQIYN